MYKFFGIILLSLWTVTVFAQDSYMPTFSTSKPTPTTTSKASNSSTILPASTGPTLSPKDFHGAVNSSYQQNQSQLKQEIQENLTKNLPVAKPNMSAPSQTAPSNQNTTQQQYNPSQVPPPAEVAPAEMPADQSQTMQQQNTQYQPTQQMPVAPVAPTQNKPYTGFGAGNNTGGKSTTAPQKSGGWNIQY